MMEFTPQQHRAVTTHGHSVIVSAAAGSGKTSVLAQRCAYLVCDAPSDQRCNVDQLLVLTFTDAAAAEMRSRIVQAIRARSRQHPGDQRLRAQLALVDAARISTIHSFCHWVLRRWFSELTLDPTATLLDADEAALLKHEVLHALMADLYASGAPSPTPLEEPDDRRPPESMNDSEARLDLGTRFVGLVDVYGLGDDRDISTLILKLHEFVNSLPEPQRWLREARDSLSDRPERVVLARYAGLGEECRRQAEYADLVASALETGDPVGHAYAASIRAYLEQLHRWESALPAIAGQTGESTASPEWTRKVLAQLERVRAHIANFEFVKTRAPRLAKDTPPERVQARNAARDHLKHIREDLFARRLKKPFALFSIEESMDDLRKIAPFVSTIVDLVRAFGDAYGAQKRRLDVLDFSDLERFAFKLLAHPDAPGKPSDVTRTLHRRFAHVLVDEFQDINPIQRAIIRLVSHESDPNLPDNLFVVGDIKQSIYRFRLAEPSIFAERMATFHSDPSAGETIALQTNFRSRAAILESVNLLFRQLLPPGGGHVAYDAQAELRPGRDQESDQPHPVELHVLERRLDGDLGDDEILERGRSDLGNAARWIPIEREAFLIGALIRRWMKNGPLTVDHRRPRFRDMAVLLRATKVNAERMAIMLTAMGIPAYADVGGSLFAAREVRDVLAALHVLDNFQQDIPLTAALRSGILGESLTEDDLVEIRCRDHNIPFHEAVRRYIKDGPESTLRDRLGVLLDRINRFRHEVRRRPLADLLWDLYERQGFLAYTCGLPNGVQRRANLLKLHELARRFGSFRKQGLHRFLRFIESLGEENRDIATAPAIGESDDVVRIMSIHQSKGLEFPVVFVAGLGTKFNLGDRSGRMIFERTAKIGLRRVDPERMIEYPTAAHTQAAAEIEKHTRDEELRILYVAMTRARDKLVLVGSKHHAERCRTMTAAGPPPLSRLSIVTAMTPLDWLLPALAAAPPDSVRGLGGENVREPLIEVHVHDSAEITGWTVEDPTDRQGKLIREAVARCEKLPPTEPLSLDDPHVDDVSARLDYVYPTLTSGTMRAAIAASQFKGTFDFTRDPEQRPGPALAQETPARQPPDSPGRARDEGIRRGLVTHRVLEHLDFAAADSAHVASELQRMESEGTITGEDRALVDQAGIEWFLSTPLAAEIRRAESAYRREFQYIATEPAAFFDRSASGSPDDEVLVRGVVDGILAHPERLEIVDFKTDAIRPDEVHRRAECYRPQMELYARAMSRIWRRPVRACWLVFITARKLIELRDLNLG